MRLGCEAYALDLNPVAHLIELCTLVYPQKYGPQLAEDVEKWGQWVLERVQAEIGDLYPPIPDPRSHGGKATEGTEDTEKGRQLDLFGSVSTSSAASPNSGMLIPIAYLWTRIVRCPNPNCGGTVPLYRQTWLRNDKGRYVALKAVPDREIKQVRFSVVYSDAETEKQAISEFGFDPAIASSRGNVTCPFYGSSVLSDYLKSEGQSGRLGTQPIALFSTRNVGQGKVYIAESSLAREIWPNDDEIQIRIALLCEETGLSVPQEPLPPQLTGGMCTLYGLNRYGDLFTPRQLLALLTFAKYIRDAHEIMLRMMDSERATIVATYLGLAVSRLSDFCSSLCVLNSTGGRGVKNTFSRQALPMVWDFAETNPFNDIGAGWPASIEAVTSTLKKLPRSCHATQVTRGSATKLPYSDGFFDAIITDPPYYDNISYADLSDFFYVWLKRSIGSLYPEHFVGELTPKKSEAIVVGYRHNGDKVAAQLFYEKTMADSLIESYRVLKAAGPLVVVYAHKTTSGWATLVDSLRRAGFVVTEAWPLETEKRGRTLSLETAALASSIFLVARRREGETIGDYVRDVRPQLTEIVRERVNTLMAEGITGADLVIATVGAGLRAYTQYAQVELASGEELKAADYLEEVQREVAELILEKVMGADRHGTGGVDPRTRYYILGRYEFGTADVPFDEANILARGIGVELDAPNGLTWGRGALTEKHKDVVRLRDYRERGEQDDLGLPQNGARAPLVDVLHRLLWLAENAPLEIPQFLVQAQPDAGQLRLVAQALAGRALAAEPTPGAMRDTRTREQGAIDRLLAAWKRVVEESLFVR